MLNLPEGLYLRDESLSNQVEKAIKGGASFVQLREKDLQIEELLIDAKEIKEICSKYKIPFVINDNVHLAMEIDADGVHVGQDDMESRRVRELIGRDKILGVSVQTVEQAIAAEKAGADYLGVGAVFKTDSKSDADEVSHESLKKKLFHQAILLTPNIPEASVLSGIEIKNEDDMIKAAKIISEEYKCAVLCKGGHRINDANDLLYRYKEYKWFIGERIFNDNTHGTGCTLSSAIASNLAKGKDLETSIQISKEYISGSLKAMLDLGKGSGPLNHMWNID